ncbi:GntR family transcriptional regulator [Paludibacter jiangxiensis]|uniref:DNA-binding transcriptional regulator YhcF, GntR family n=1 Tax=Paludibacter jiangxiensis TaxID=681398 RepID=A0A170ZB29_9BACT|nr:GntR family transcriptional regulator [Paludibacter jiangxiensis]GAT62481.1 DNA-binding transcriptional regulator YhcF, GntR family [Paludibacter jiangxiensis]
MKFSNKVSKVNQVIDHITSEIADGVYALDDRLPSVNELSQKIHVSRDTVFKAYKELKQRGLIDAAPMKGYFVLDEVKRVLLLLDVYSPFKEKLYNAFVENLPENVKVDLLFHQYNEKLFDMIVGDSIGKYNSYVVMNFRYDEMTPSLLKLPSSKLLLLDFCSFPKEGLSYIGQNFDEGFYAVLESALEQLRKYKRLVFVFPEDSVHPKGAGDAFARFCRDYHFNYEVQRIHFQATDLSEGDAYVCIMTDDLVAVVAAANKAGYKFGKEVGVAVYNDMPLLEIIQEGVSAFSIDFARLGEMAASFVMTGEKIQVDMPTCFVERKSL